MADCEACDGGNTSKAHICRRLANPDVQAELIAATEPDARCDCWQDAVDAEVEFRYGVVGANVLGGGFGRVFVVKCCGGSGLHDLTCAVYCRICYDDEEETDPVFVLPGSSGQLKRKTCISGIRDAFKKHCQDANRGRSISHHLCRYAALADGQVHDVVRRMISELHVTEPPVPVSGMIESSVVASSAFSVAPLLDGLRAMGGARAYARAARDGLPAVTLTIPQPSKATMKPVRVLALDCGVEAWKVRVGAEHEPELVLAGQSVASILAETTYVGAMSCGSESGHRPTPPLYACVDTGRLKRLAEAAAGPAPREGLTLVPVARSRLLLRERDHGWSTAGRGDNNSRSVSPWSENARPLVKSALAQYGEVIASSSVSEPDKALARDARSYLLSRGYGRLRLPEFVAKFRERAAPAPAPSAVPALPPLPAASPAPATAPAGLSIDGGAGETARVARRDDESLPPI